MNDELDKILKQAGVPERSPGYWEHFPKRVTAQLGVAAAVPGGRGWYWMAGVAAVCLLIAFGLFLRPQRVSKTDYAKLYREISGMFPHQVRAIVEDEHGVHLVLSEQPDMPQSPALLVRVCQPQRCRSVITFSGQQMNINGDVWDVLLNGQNHVIVAGRLANRYRIEGRTL